MKWREISRESVGTEITSLGCLLSSLPLLGVAGSSIPILTTHCVCSQDKWLSNLSAHQDHLGHLFWSPIPKLLTQDLQLLNPQECNFQKAPSCFRCNCPENPCWDYTPDVPWALGVPLLKAPLPKFPIRWRLMEPILSSCQIIQIKGQ